MHTDELEDAIYEAYDCGEIDSYDRDYLLESLDYAIYERNMENKKKKNEYVIKTGGGLEHIRKKYYNDGKGSDGNGVSENDIRTLRVTNRKYHISKERNKDNKHIGNVTTHNDDTRVYTYMDKNGEKKVHSAVNSTRSDGSTFTQHSDNHGYYDVNNNEDKMTSSVIGAKVKKIRDEKRNYKNGVTYKKLMALANRRIIALSHICLGYIEKVVNLESVKSLGYSDRLLSLMDDIAKNKEKLEADMQKVQESAHIESKLAVYEAYEYGEIDEYDRDYLLESLDDIMYEKFSFRSHKTKEQKARHNYLEKGKPSPIDISQIERTSRYMQDLSKATVNQNPTLSRKLKIVALMFEKTITIFKNKR